MWREAKCHTPSKITPIQPRHRRLTPLSGTSISKLKHVIKRPGVALHRACRSSGLQISKLKHVFNRRGVAPHRACRFEWLAGHFHVASNAICVPSMGAMWHLQEACISEIEMFMT